MADNRRFPDFCCRLPGRFFPLDARRQNIPSHQAEIFNEKDWLCKVIVRDKDISLHINGKLNNRVEWSDIKKLEEAKTYFKLTSPDGVEGVMLDKECFTEGNADSFKEWMSNVHPEIEQVPIAPAFNK